MHETVLTAAASDEMLAWNAGAVSVGALASATQVGALVLTHLLPAPATPRHEQQYIDEARSGGWRGPLHVAHDLMRLTIGA